MRFLAGVVLATAALLGCASALNLDFKDVTAFRAPYSEDLSGIAGCSGAWQLSSVVPTVDPVHGPLAVFRCDAGKDYLYAACRHTHRTDENNVTWHKICTPFDLDEPVLEKSFVLRRNELMWLTEDGKLGRLELNEKKNTPVEAKLTQLFTMSPQLPSEAKATQLAFDFRNIVQVEPRVFRDPYYIVEYKTGASAKRQQHSYLVINTRSHHVYFWDMESVNTRPAFLAADDKRVLIARENNGSAFLVWLIDWADKAYFEPENGYGVGEHEWPMPYLLEALPEEASEAREKGHGGYRPTLFRPEHTVAGMPAAILSGDRLCQPTFRGGQAWLACINATLDAATQEQPTEIAAVNATRAWTEPLAGCKHFQSGNGIAFFEGSVPRIEDGALVFGGLAGTRRLGKSAKLSKEEIYTLRIGVAAPGSASPTGEMRAVNTTSEMKALAGFGKEEIAKKTHFSASRMMEKMRRGLHLQKAVEPEVETEYMDNATVPEAPREQRRVRDTSGLFNRKCKKSAMRCAYEKVKQFMVNLVRREKPRMTPFQRQVAKFNRDVDAIRNGLEHVTEYAAKQGKEIAKDTQEEAKKLVREAERFAKQELMKRGKTALTWRERRKARRLVRLGLDAVRKIEDVQYQKSFFRRLRPIRAVEHCLRAPQTYCPSLAWFVKPMMKPLMKTEPKAKISARDFASISLSITIAAGTMFLLGYLAFMLMRPLMARMRRNMQTAKHVVRSAPQAECRQCAAPASKPAVSA